MFPWNPELITHYTRRVKIHVTVHKYLVRLIRNRRLYVTQTINGVIIQLLESDSPLLDVVSSLSYFHNNQ